MKKIFYFILLILILFIPKAYALPYDDPSGYVEGHIRIYWGDYDDKMKERPDSVDVELLEINTDERITFTLKKEDADIVKVNGQTTYWDVKVEVPLYHGEAMWQYPHSESPVESYLYSDGTGGRISEDGGTIKIYLFKDINKTIDYYLHWEVDQFRDFFLVSEETKMRLKATNSDEEYVLMCNSIKDEDEVCHGDAYIHAYKSLPDKTPVWDDPIEYEVTRWFAGDDLPFRIEADLDNNRVDVYIDYVPKKRDDIDVKVNFTNGHETQLKMNLKNQKNKIERSFETNTDTTVKELFYNLTRNTPVIYSLGVEEKANYEYEITGNADDGFVVNVTYHEPPEEPDDIPENPDTSDSIITNIILFAISLAGLATTIFIKKKKLV